MPGFVLPGCAAPLYVSLRSLRCEATKPEVPKQALSHNATKICSCSILNVPLGRFAFDRQNAHAQKATALTKSLASAQSRDQNAPLLRAQKHTLTLARPVKRNFGFRTTFHILFVLAFGENASFDIILTGDARPRFFESRSRCGAREAMTVGCKPTNIILFPILAIWQFERFYVSMVNWLVLGAVSSGCKQCSRQS